MFDIDRAVQESCLSNNCVWYSVQFKRELECKCEMLVSENVSFIGKAGAHKVLEHLCGSVDTNIVNAIFFFFLVTIIVLIIFVIQIKIPLAK